MHLCVVFGAMLRPPGGAERVVAEEATRFADAGHEVTVLTKSVASEYRERFAEHDRLDIAEYENGNQIVHEPPRLRRKLSAIDPDFVLSHYQDEGVYMATRSLPGKIPYACHVHGSPLWFTKPDRIVPHRGTAAYERLVAEVPGHGQFTEGSLSMKYRLLGEAGERIRKRALGRARFVSTGSEQVARELSGLYGVDAQVVRPGVAASWTEATGTTDAPSWEWGETVVSVSRLDRRKRIGLLIRAVSRLRADHGRDVGLVVCGTGSAEARLRSLVADLGVESGVRFVGYVPDEAIPAYYRSADAFACPAWMSYGLSPLEAYATGTRVVLSTDTYVKEILGGAPGVAVVEPTVAAWTDALTAAVSSSATPDPKIVPTWRQYFEHKRRLVERHTFDP